MNTRWMVVVAWVGMLAAGLPGCGLTADQKAAVVKFGGATADLGAIAGEEFVRSRQDVIELNRRRFLLRAQPLPGRDSEMTDLDGPLDAEDVAVRVQAAQALEAYGALLVELAAGSDAAAIQAASGALVGNLTKLRAMGHIKTSDERLAGIGKAVAMVGMGAEEAMRARATKEVAVAAGPAVREVAELIKRDFDLEQPHWSKGVTLTARLLKSRIDDMAADSNGGIDLDAERLATATEAETLRVQTLARIETMAPKVREAAELLLRAEGDLRDALVATGLSLEDLDPFVAKVVEVKVLYRVLTK